MRGNVRKERRQERKKAYMGEEIDGEFESRGGRSDKKEMFCG